MIRMKAMFFDRKAVIDKTDAATRRVLSKFGAFVRRGAKSSIRKRKRISDPGSPPSSHKGLLKRFIFFGYDLDKRSVVIGPEKLGKGEAPALLEYGGTATRQVRVPRTGRKAYTARQARAYRKKVLAGEIKPPRRPTTTKSVTYAARPFMGPAFDREKPKLPVMWKESVR